MAFAFEKLLIYQKAIDFAEQVCQRTGLFPRGYGFLIEQLSRTALSIAANIADGNGRFTKTDRRTFLASPADLSKSASLVWNWQDDDRF
jgi:hypothetical protein